MSDEKNGKSFRIRVLVRPRPEILDPQGKAITQALERLGLAGISSVRAGKAFDLEIAADDVDAALERATQTARRLLANPVTEDYEVVAIGEGTR